MAIMRGHNVKVIGRRERGDVRVRFFTEREVGVWNALPAVVTFGTFKQLLDRHMDDSKMKGLQVSSILE